MGSGSSTASPTQKEQQGPVFSPLELAMKQMFTAIDTEKNGTLDTSELLAKFEKDNQLSKLIGTEGWSPEACVSYLKERFDTNRDGKISFSEFAGIFVLFLIREQATRIFTETDTDKSGYCSKEELLQKIIKDSSLEKFTGVNDGNHEELSFNIFSQDHNGRKILDVRDSVFEALDTNDDGQVSLDEFLAFAEKKYVATHDGAYYDSLEASMEVAHAREQTAAPESAEAPPATTAVSSEPAASSADASEAGSPPVEPSGSG